jgi:hypothetical protein
MSAFYFVSPPRFAQVPGVRGSTGFDYAQSKLPSGGSRPALGRLAGPDAEMRT